VQGLDRYAYTNNNPIRYNDPTGHDVSCPGENASECSKPKPTPTPTRTPPTTILACGYNSGTGCSQHTLHPYEKLGATILYGATTEDDKYDVAQDIFDQVAKNPGSYNLVGHSAGGTAVIWAVAKLIETGYAERINNVVLLDPAIDPGDWHGVDLQGAANKFDSQGIQVFLGDYKGEGNDSITGAVEYETDNPRFPELNNLNHDTLATSEALYHDIVTNSHWR
jgi:pimeloyl-ACP methyl ester carboxylesterase